MSAWNLGAQPDGDNEVSEQTKILARKRKRGGKKKKAKPTAPQSDSEEEATVTLETPG